MQSLIRQRAIEHDDWTLVKEAQVQRFCMLLKTETLSFQLNSGICTNLRSELFG